MSVIHTWPTDLQFVDGFKIAPSQPSIVTRFSGGATQGVSYHDRATRRYTGRLADFGSTTDKLDQLLAFCDHVGLRRDTFRFKEQLSDTHRRMLIGIGDGSTTTFAVPLFGYTGTLRVAVDRVHQMTESGYTPHTTLNMLTSDDVANAVDSITGLDTVGTCTPARSTICAADGLTSIKFTMSSQGDVGVETDSDNIVSVSEGDIVTARASFVGSSGGAGTAKVEVVWYDGLKAEDSSANATATMGTDTEDWTEVSKTATTPAGIFYAGVRATRTTNSSATFHIGCLGLNHGDCPDWYLPSVTPGCIEFDSAPAAGEVVSLLEGTGNALRLVRLDDDELWAALHSPGRAIPNTVAFTEAWES